MGVFTAATNGVLIETTILVRGQTWPSANVFQSPERKCKSNASRIRFATEYEHVDRAHPRCFFFLFFTTFHPSSATSSVNDWGRKKEAG